MGTDASGSHEPSGRSRSAHPSTSSVLEHGLAGLSAAVTGNAQAFGFSVTITVTFGAVEAVEGNPSRWALLGFALAAVAAFSVLNAATAWLLHRTGEPETTTRTMLVGTATDFLAVGAAVGAAIGAAGLAHGWGAWVLAPFVAGIVYVVVQSVELAVGRERSSEPEEDEG